MTTGAKHRGATKFSASLPTGELVYLEQYAQLHGLASRSAALHAAVRALREQELASEYAQAYAEWDDSGEAAAWDGVASDGIDGPA
ncbi:antitoxin [Cellulomonas uda]|uniref:Antitoxin MazE9 n=1 Tax=Cellulomonas uda TaxID=1714 RepID=A0A4Y3KDY4_CELUD|nr:antitoxin [Cellulomonas uda]NII67240.1 hypothetical protein [Cellulomonas uda]GEA81584.1 hypothetical protein CUD01_20280 [Cellulomonas uda]